MAITPENLALAKALVIAGATYVEAASQVGISATALYDRLRPERRLRARRRHQANVSAVVAAKRASGHRYDRLDIDVLKARLREIPQDTRDLTARFFGDPLKGRSALDRNGAG